MEEIIGQGILQKGEGKASRHSPYTLPSQHLNLFTNVDTPRTLSHLGVFMEISLYKHN